MLKKIFATSLAVAALAVAGQAGATELTVKMLDKGAQGMMVFEPSTAKLKPGDTVRFVPTDTGHNVETILDMLPPGVTATKGAIGKEVIVKFAKPGTYGFKCAPHWGFGMAFIAKVGDGAPNLAAAEAAVAKAPGMAKKRLTADFAAIK